MADPYMLARVIGGDSGAGWVLRQGVVTGIGDYGVSVRVGGAESAVTGVRYLGAPPLPGAGVWLLANDGDMIVLGSLAAAGRTVAPRAYRTTSLPIASGVLTTMLFEAADNDPLGFYSFQHADHLVCWVPGRYVAVADVIWASSAAGIREVSVEIKGQTTVGRSRISAASSGTTEQTFTSPPFALAQGDEVRLLVQQTSGGSLDLNVADAAPSLSLIYLGP